MGSSSRFVAKNVQLFLLKAIKKYPQQWYLVVRQIEFLVITRLPEAPISQMILRRQKKVRDAKISKNQEIFKKTKEYFQVNKLR